MDAEKPNVESSRGNSSQTEAVDTLRTKAEQPIDEASSNERSDRDGESIHYVGGVRYGAISFLLVLILLTPSKQASNVI